MARRGFKTMKLEVQCSRHEHGMWSLAAYAFDLREARLLAKDVSRKTGVERVRIVRVTREEVEVFTKDAGTEGR